MNKRYKANSELVEPEKTYSLEEALDLIGKQQKTKFDESVDIAVRLGVDPKLPDQMVRGTISMPHGTGKKVRVIVFAKGDKIEEAKQAGADEAGADELVAKVAGGWTDFDNAVATPDMMGAVGKLGKVLGPRGLMPNPKLGTVTPDVAKAVKELKAGRVEYRAEKNGIIQTLVGKKSFEANHLKENVNSLMETLVRAKPASAKGVYIRSVTLSTTMGPGIHLDAGAWAR